MLFKTRGIILKYTKYKESSLIVNIYTEEFGLGSYIINSVRSKKSKTGMGLFQPLNLVELVVYNKENVEINRISEIRSSHPYHSIPSNIKKSSIVIFLTEVLYKCLRTSEQDQDKELFSFIFHSLILLDSMDTGLVNFHLAFLLKLSKYLGFAADIEVEFQELGKDTFGIVEQLLEGNYYDEITLDRLKREKILNSIIHFYQHHIHGFGELKSFAILKEVFLPVR